MSSTNSQTQQFSMPIPLEILERIVQAADPETRGSLLTVSRPFQAATERYYSNWDRRTFNPDTDVEEFLAMYSGHRVRFLRNLRVSVYFPKLRHTKEKPLACRETMEELQEKNEQFTRQIREVFRAIKTLEERGAGNISLTIDTPFQDEDGNKSCDHRRHCSWRLRFIDPEILPVLSSVRMLRIAQNGWYNPITRVKRVRRPLDMDIIPSLLGKLPNLDTLDCDYLTEDWPQAYKDAICAHFRRPWEGPWRDARHAFATTTMADVAVLPARIRRAKLIFGRWQTGFPLLDQSKAFPNLVHPLAYDPFSAAMRVLSQRVIDLELQVCVDSGVFWPSANEIKEDAVLPTWPELSTLKVTFHPMLPSGAWYFQGPGGQGRNATGFQINAEHYPPVSENEVDKEQDKIWEDEWGRYEDMRLNEFRIAPIDEHIEPLLEAFAKALGRMPVLKEAELCTLLSWDPSEELEEAYPDLGFTDDGFRWGVKCQADVPRIEWQVGDWRPSEGVRDLLRKSLGRNGKEAVEEWFPLEM